MRLSALSASLVFSLCAQAGWVIDEIASYAGGEEFASTVTIDSGRYKSRNSDETLIIDLNNESVYFIYDKDKKYFGGKLSGVLEDLRGSLYTEMNEDENVLSAPDENEEEHMPTIEIKRVGEKFKAGGFTGEKYQVIVDGELKKELFISPALTANDEIDPRKLSETMLLIGGATNPTAAKYPELSDEYLALMKKGYPIRTVEYDPGGGMVLTVIVKAEKRKISPDEFAPPKDYVKISSKDIYKPLE